jgi:4-hydroxy-tetrahydrodipicolinate synthase
MLYNNPLAYETDFLPPQIEELAIEHSNLAAVKESSGDLRRFEDLRARLGDRVGLFVGIDDQILEGLARGAVGWIAGLANALPHESVRLFESRRAGRMREARDLFEWFWPLLRMDAHPKLVQLIKLVEQAVGVGNARVRPPRLELTGDELSEAKELIQTTLAHRPRLLPSGPEPELVRS